VPASMCGRKASCCALLKRCTSSTNKSTGPRPEALQLVSALDDELDLAHTGGDGAEAVEVGLQLPRRSRRASVVLPLPGGPRTTASW
jgi:hypothetical protein